MKVKEELCDQQFFCKTAKILSLALRFLLNQYSSVVFTQLSLFSHLSLCNNVLCMYQSIALVLHTHSCKLYGYSELFTYSASSMNRTMVGQTLHLIYPLDWWVGDFAPCDPLRVLCYLTIPVVWTPSCCCIRLWLHQNSFGVCQPCIRTFHHVVF